MFYPFASGQEDIVKDGLVLWLDAGDRTSYPGGGNVWRDLSNGGNNGTLINGPTFNSGNGGNIVFDGVDDYVDVNQQIQFDNLNSFTLNAWINSINSNNNQIINNEDSNYRGYQLAINTSGGLSFLFRNTVSVNFIGTSSLSTISANSWNYVNAVYNGSSDANGVKLYINGIEQEINITGNNLTSTTISDQTTWIGRRRPTTQGPFNGNIATVQIYNRALSANEVSQNFNASRTRFGI